MCGHSALKKEDMHKSIEFVVKTCLKKKVNSALPL